MICSFKYILLLFLIIYIILIFYNQENFKNYELKDIQFDTKLAGAIDDKYQPELNLNQLNLELLEYEIKSKRLRPIETKVPDDNITSEKYSIYEKILPNNFKTVTSSRKQKIVPIYSYDPSKDPYNSLDSDPSIKLTDKDKSPFEMKDDDCYGEFEKWDTTNCKDERRRCSLKFRKFRVIKPKKKEGNECMYKGNPVKDGDIVYDFCYGNNNKDRCGINKNLCNCDLKDSTKCIPNDLKSQVCNCVPGTVYEDSVRNKLGKCNPIADTTNSNGWNEDINEITPDGQGWKYYLLRNLTTIIYPMVDKQPKDFENI